MTTITTSGAAPDHEPPPDKTSSTGSGGRGNVVSFRKPLDRHSPAAGPDDTAPLAPVERMVFEGELVTDTRHDGESARPGTAVALRRAGAVARRRTVHVITTTRRVATHQRTRTVAKGTARQVWFPIAGAAVVVRRWQDSHGARRYERMMRAAEIAGDHEALLEWEARDVAEKARRHQRVMDWITSPLQLVKALAVGAAAAIGLLLALGVVLAVAHGDVAQVIGPITAVVEAIAFLVWFFTAYGTLLLTGATVAAIAYLWQLGRAQVDPPAWVAPAATGDDGGRDVVPDERAIVSALRNLNLPAINKKFKEGWQPRWVLQPVHDGKGWHAQLLLPEGVTVEMIVDRKAVLAHNLLRLPVEVWPTEPRDKPGVMDLWVADQGSLTKPVPPWPLLHKGSVDYFKGVPVGIDPRGNVVIGRLFATNWGVAGTMGSGKSTLIITTLLGAMLDPLVDIDVYCMAINADYDPLKPRLRTLFKSDEPEHIPQVLDALKQLMSELSERGRILSEKGEPKLTRALAEADPRMRPRVVVIDECQELFVSDIGEEAAELVEKIVAKARKYGVTMIFATPVPSADSLPRKVAKVLSNRACFAIGDHQGNDAILGTGKHTAGISATTLRPMTQDAQGNVDPGDIGTAMTVGFTPQDGLLRCYYIRRGEGLDEVTPVVKRALGILDDAGGVPAPSVEPTQDVRDPLADIAEVLSGHKRLRTQEVLQQLAERDRATYASWTPGQLKAYLAEHDIRTVKDSEGRMCVRALDVHTALADRANTDPDDLDTPAYVVTDGDDEAIEDGNDR
ncbi:zonular occludens toxin domain-containing protein [Pseudonocardia zijingensis]|uniref:Cell division protein FtsK n=1 Tax=Pseudonocardia zijingensis TaxID=153376 RepID=A0ABP3YTH7_9PSEU